MARLIAYPDSKCAWGYMTICADCTRNAPKHVDILHPITNPPAVGKVQSCELCGNRGLLDNPTVNEC